MKIILFIFSILLFFPKLVFSIDIESSHSAHLKLQGNLSHFPSESLESALRDSDVFEGIVDFRLSSEFQLNSFKTVFHGEFLSLFDEREALELQTASIFDITSLGLPNDRSRAMRLTYNIDEDSSFSSVARLDRAYLEYQREQLTTRIGRQSISWGNGLLFNVFDVFNPFSPTEIDRDYKPGDDMFFSQIYFDDRDIQFVSVARRDESGSLDSNSSSFAIKIHESLLEQSVDLDIIAAQHFDEAYLGIGLSKSIFSGVFRADALWVEGQEISAIVNFDRTWDFYGKNLYSFVEYYRSGFGSSDGSITEAASERISRGEIFVTAKDYLSIGSNLEIHPLANHYNSLIYNVNDVSGIFQTRLELDILQDFSVFIGANIALGSRGTEFGGRPLSEIDSSALLPQGLSTSTIGPADSYYVRLAHFF